MHLLLSIFSVMTGLAFGSFLNVCISRLPHHESVVAPRSRCPRCRTPILNRDNFPLLSWILLRGRCRSCGIRIPARYPMIEAATAALSLLCFLVFGLSFSGVGAAVLCWLLLGLAAMDAETMLLPDALTLPGMALGVVFAGFKKQGFAFAFSWRPAAVSLVWAVSAAALILLIRGLYRLLRRREGLGLGDAKLMATIAAWLGLEQTVLVLFLAVVCAAIYGLARIVWESKRWEKSGRDRAAMRVPLGAFLSAAGIFSIFEGKALLDWYLRFLF